MLGRGRKLFCIFFLTGIFFSCRDGSKKSDYVAYSINLIGKKEYYSIYNKICDTVKLRSRYRIGYYQYLGSSKYYAVDSVLCFNKNQDRLISAILMQQKLREGKGDDIDILLGEKINGDWHFWTGLNIFLPRDKYNKDDLNSPLKFKELHQIALKEIYSNYLLPNGEINEEWFTSQFEGPGWYKWDETPEQVKKLTRKDFELRHLEYVRRMWEGRDTTKVLP
jgi:hypothetical protein